MQNILFVLYHDFRANSSVHVHNFANNLVKQGLDCTVVVPQHKETVSVLGQNLYKAANFNEIDHLRKLFPNNQDPDIVHVWTPREIVRAFYEELAKRYRFRLFIHLEDNEELLLEKFTQKTLSELIEDTQYPFPNNLSHPIKYREFLSKCDGVTVIIDRLQEFVPTPVPTCVLWPGVDNNLFFPKNPDPDLTTHLGIPLNSTVLCYTGNVHPANAYEVRSLYLAVAMLNREGYPTTLVRAGQDYCEFLSAEDSWARKYELGLGYVENHKIPDILALADVLVQPGKEDAFNDYRLPSKLPEFLAMGKPVILPKTNIGRFMESMKDAIVLSKVDALTIVETIKLLVNNQDLCEQLGAGASGFSKTHLDWIANSKKLLDFYLSTSSN